MFNRKMILAAAVLLCGCSRTAGTAGSVTDSTTAENTSMEETTMNTVPSTEDDVVEDDGEKGIVFNDARYDIFISDEERHKVFTDSTGEKSFGLTTYSNSKGVYISLENLTDGCFLCFGSHYELLKSENGKMVPCEHVEGEFAFTDELHVKQKGAFGILNSYFDLGVGFESYKTLNPGTYRVYLGYYSYPGNEPYFCDDITQTSSGYRDAEKIPAYVEFEVKRVLTEEEAAQELQTVMINADYPAYGSMDKLKEAADAMIVGKVIQSRQVVINTGSSGIELVPHIIYTFEVEKVIKGENIINVMDVSFVGGELDGSMWVEEGVPELEINGEYLISVKTFEDAYPCAVNPYEGVLKVNDGKIEAFGNIYCVDDL